MGSLYVLCVICHFRAEGRGQTGVMIIVLAAWLSFPHMFMLGCAAVHITHACNSPHECIVLCAGFVVAGTLIVHEYHCYSLLAHWRQDFTHIGACGLICHAIRISSANNSRVVAFQGLVWHVGEPVAKKAQV